MSHPICILADDLTGAADATTYFRTRDRRVCVRVSAALPWNFAASPQIVQVYDAETRKRGVHSAFEEVKRVCDLLRTNLPSGFLFYKKVDSTLRGHLGAELEAALVGLDRQVAVFAPALPAQRRTVRDGHLMLNGVPIHHTPFAHDPLFPIGDSDVSVMVQRTTNLPTVTCRAVGHLAELLSAVHVHSTRRIFIVDAESEEDLAAIAQIIAYRQDVLPCGSAGLAAALARVWGGDPRDAPEMELGSAAKHGQRCAQVLVAVGSANPVARRQAESLLHRYAIQPVVMDTSLLIDEAEGQSELNRSVARLRGGAVGQGEGVGSGSASATSERTRTEGSNVSLLMLSDARVDAVNSNSLVEAMAGVVAVWLRERPDAGVVVTGGDTLYAVCGALGATAVWPEGEVVPGVPWSEVDTPTRRVAVVSKAGGFGEEDVLVRAVEFLMEEKSI